MSRPSDLAALARAAERLARRAEGRNARLPALLILTDPSRTGDPVALAERVPPGTALVYRAFGAGDALAVARRIAAVARRRRLLFLVGADAALARAGGAHGVHLPERLLSSAPRLRARWPDALITGAAHGARALHRARRLGLDAALLSPVFPSLSPSAGAPLGVLRFAALVRDAGLPVFALGGVDAATLLSLRNSGAGGVAVVGAATPVQTRA